jgi:hypothetical protein
VLRLLGWRGVNCVNQFHPVTAKFGITAAIHTVLVLRVKSTGRKTSPVSIVGQMLALG